MPIEISWLIPQRVILERIYGDVTIEDLQSMAETVPPFIQEGIPLIHTIIDARDLVSHPNIREVQQHAYLETFETEGWRVMVGANAIARFIASIVLQIMGQRYRMYSTLDEAMQFIAEQDDSIDYSDFQRRTGT